MRLALVPLTALLVLATAGAAHAETVKLRGRTSQGFTVTARLVDGRLDRVHFRWRARCGKGQVYRAYTTWLDGDDHVIEQDGRTFSDSGTVRHNLRRQRMRVVRRERIAGRFRAGPRLTGTHRTTVRVRRGGRPYVTCRSSIRWTAR
jgi:hypothetical protein